MKQNILLIQVDQMRADCMSLLGHHYVKTPNLDCLAGEGVLFSHATCNSPICMPSRVSMMSGQYPATTGQYGFSGQCRHDLTWLPGICKEAGYRTGAFGKFHTLCVTQADWSFDVAAPTLPEDEDYARPVGNHYRAYCREHSIPWPTDQIHGHNPYDYECRPRRHSGPSDVPLKHSLETYTTDRCIDFIRESARHGQGFFGWLSYDRPHDPTTLPTEWFDRVCPERVELEAMPAAAQLGNLPPSLLHAYLHSCSLVKEGEESFRLILATYLTLIEWIDSEVGRVMSVLEELGIDDDTMVLFTADHGDEAGFRGLYGKLCNVSSEAITRVPLIIRPAPNLGIESGRMIHEPVELIDLAPTVLSLCGLETPPGSEGRDLSAGLRRSASLDRSRPVFCEDYFKRMVTKEGWKLVFDACHSLENELYDLTADPDCFDNRYDDPTCAEQRLELKRELLSFMLQRLHGGYTKEDVAELDAQLADDGELLPPLVRAPVDGIQYFRGAAALSSGRGHVLYVPFRDSRMLLFSDLGRDKIYPRKRDALTFDVEVAEGMLNKALLSCYGACHPISLLIGNEEHNRYCPQERAGMVEEIFLAMARQETQAGCNALGRQ